MQIYLSLNVLFPRRLTPLKLVSDIQCIQHCRETERISNGNDAIGS